MEKKTEPNQNVCGVRLDRPTKYDWIGLRKGYSVGLRNNIGQACGVRLDKSTEFGPVCDEVNFELF